MSDDARNRMYFEANKKSTGLTYLIWFFLGMLGAHRFYAGRTGTGAVILILTLFGILTSFIGIGFVFLAIAGLWLLIDLFLIPSMIQQHNNNLINSLAP